PNFAIRDDMSNTQNTGGQRYGSGNETFIFQEGGSVRFEREEPAPSNEAGIARARTMPFEKATRLYNARTSTTGLVLWVLSGSEGYLFNIPNTGGVLMPFLIRISNGQVEYYGAGTSLEGWYAVYENSNPPRFQFYVDENDTGRFEIEQFYFTDQAIDIPA